MVKHLGKLFWDLCQIGFTAMITEEHLLRAKASSCFVTMALGASIDFEPGMVAEPFALVAFTSVEHSTLAASTVIACFDAFVDHWAVALVKPMAALHTLIVASTAIASSYQHDCFRPTTGSFAVFPNLC